MGEIVEEYKDIIDYENTYQISNFGNVRNKNTGRILKNCVNNVRFNLFCPGVR